MPAMGVDLLGHRAQPRMAGGGRCGGANRGHNQLMPSPLTAPELLDRSETLAWTIQSIRQGHLTSGRVGTWWKE